MIIKVNPARLHVPPEVVTETLPEVPDPTVAVIWVSESTLKLIAPVPPKETELALAKCSPVMMTDWPGLAEVGENELITGV